MSLSAPTTNIRVERTPTSVVTPDIAFAGDIGSAAGSRWLTIKANASTTLRTSFVEDAQGEPADLLDHDEWLSLVDRAAQRSLNMSGEEFVRRLKAGEFGDPDDDPKVMRIVMLLPSGW